MLSGPALAVEVLEAAIAAGARLAAEAADAGVDCLALGEIGMGNTTTAAALACALTGAPPAAMVGRGAGVDAAGLERKRELVGSALARHGSPLDARAALLALGGLELAALLGALTEGARRGLPVVLDGYAVGVAALAGARLQPAAGEALIASHRSAEPGHDLVLRELGLEAVLDLRLRLGEASGALLALPILAAAGALHAQMATFEEAGVKRRG
jgi:nicotinate-nucleotide--dimethylbenzimidazole phosphoribosyltransferase